MDNLKQRQIEEAIKRLKLLKVSKNVLEEFKESQRLYYSERQNKFFDGILFWLDNNPEYVKVVKGFESHFGGLVYHAQLVHTQFGDLLSLLYVSKHEEEWKEDLEIIEEGYVIAYVYNLDYTEGEFGSIGVEPKNGGIGRTW